MFDNVALQVVIGLVLIYLLYSLLVTLISEFISVKFGIRARLLRIAIERMFNDGYYQKIERKKNKWWQGWIRKEFLYEPEEFKTSFAGLFYDYPAIKYLSRIEDDHKGRFNSSKPSYISAAYFADSLINFMADKGSGSTEMDKIAFCLKFNTYHIQPKTLKQFRNLFESAGNNKEVYRQNLIRWFTETMDRTNGWHKRKMRVISFWIGFIIAASFNVDSIRIAKILANDKDARGQLVTMSVALAKDSSRYKEFVNGKGDTLHGQSIIDTGFAHVTKDINAANIILGLGWQFTDSLKAENVSINREDILLQKQVDSMGEFISVQKNIRTKLSASSVQLAKNRYQLYTLLNGAVVMRNQLLNEQDDISLTDTTLSPQAKRVHDSIITGLNKRIASDTIRIRRIKREVESIIAEMKTDSGSLEANNVLTRMMYADINRTSGKYLRKIDSIVPPRNDEIYYDWDFTKMMYADINRSPENKLPVINIPIGTENYEPGLIYGKRYYSLDEKSIFILTHIFWGNLIGFLLTALALAMGAPFWFDMLNKLIAVRGVGVKPEEKKDKIADVTPAGVNNNAGSSVSLINENPVDTALRIYGDQIRKEKGVVNVARGYFPENGTPVRCVQVNVDNDITAVEIKTKYSLLRIAENQFVHINVLVTGKPKLSSGFDGLGHIEKGICGDIKLNNIGSYGCLVKKISDRKKTFLLSCYHVMNTDRTWENRKVQQEIISKEGVISQNYEGFLTNLMDTALAEITDQTTIDRYKAGLKCKIPEKIREVSADDVFKTQAFIEGYSTMSSIGLIVNDSSSETFNYPQKGKIPMPHVLDDLIIISHRESEFPDFKGTSPGDSGTVVLDEKLNALGIVVGSDLIHTYVIKIDTIFRFLGLELVTA